MFCNDFVVLMQRLLDFSGFGVLLPKNECQLGRGRRTSCAPPDIQGHLQAMLHLLCQGDTLHMVR